MPHITCPTCARSIDVPLEYLSAWVECAQCAQHFLPLTGDVRTSFLKEQRSYDCLVCDARFWAYVPVEANRPHCPRCDSSDTLPSESAVYLRPKRQDGKPREVFNPIDPKLNQVVSEARPNRRRFPFRRKTRDDRMDYWIVALIIGLLLVLGGFIVIVVSVLAGKE